MNDYIPDRDEISDSINIKNNFESFINITRDSYNHWCLDNSFVIFKSINDIFFLVYSTAEKSIILFNLVESQKTSEIKNSHIKHINIFRHYYDKKNKKDIIMSVSCEDNNIKLWDINKCECILNLINVNKNGHIFSACFLNNNFENYNYTDNYILSSNYGLFYDSDPIKVFDFNGNKIKEINIQDVYYINTYYDKEFCTIFIIIGNDECPYSYDFNKDKIYHKYYLDYNVIHRNVIVYEYDSIVKLIACCDNGLIKIWNFHNNILLDKIKIEETSIKKICLWNYKYLFIGSNGNTIKILDLNKRKIVKSLIGHNNNISNIQKIYHPLYGNCIISQGWFKDQIKLWINLDL